MGHLHHLKYEKVAFYIVFFFLNGIEFLILGESYNNYSKRENILGTMQNNINQRQRRPYYMKNAYSITNV